MPRGDIENVAHFELRRTTARGAVALSQRKLAGAEPKLVEGSGHAESDTQTEPETRSFRQRPKEPVSEG